MPELNLLLVDDDPEASTLMELMLGKKAPQFKIQSVESFDEALELIGMGGIDCVLSDYQMPGKTGLELLKELRGMGNEVPFIFITGQGNEEVASEAFRDGANDYFTKDIGFAHFPRIINSVEQAVGKRKAKDAEASYQAERLEYNRRLETAKKQWEDTFNAISDPVTIHDKDFNIIQANAATVSALGMKLEDIVGRKCYELFHRRGAPIADCPMAELLGSGAAMVAHEVDVNGREFEVRVYPMVGEGGLRLFVHVAKDITERKQAEDAKARSRRILDTILQSVQFGMMVVGRDKTIRRVNTAALGIMGYGSDAELVGRMCYEKICPAGEKSCPVLDLGQKLDHSIRTLKTRDGRQKKIVKSATPVTLGDEDVLLESFVELRGDLEDLDKAA